MEKRMYALRGFFGALGSFLVRLLGVAPVARALTSASYLHAG